MERDMSKLKVTPEEYFNTQDTSELTHEDYCNAIKLLVQVNKLREHLGLPFVVTSGYRSPSYNKSINGAKNSSHCRAAAVDIADRDGKLYAAVTANSNKLLVEYDLYAEDRLDAPTWLHLSILPPKSGSRVFRK